MSLVPVLRPAPIFAYSSPPFRMIQLVAAMVSTLLTTVGRPHTPDTAGKGGLMRGFPRFPSNDSINAVSSPQIRSEEHTSELQSLMRISYAVFCLKKKNTYSLTQPPTTQ